MKEGQQIGPFVIDRVLGGGAMGTVYRARYTKTGARVALKVIAPGLADNDSSRARFDREAAILKQLNHPNIVRFYGAGRTHGTPFYAMEYVEGESLDHVLGRRGRMTWEELVPLGQQLCAALQHAHEHGIIHRDLKPSNLMVLRDGTVKLTDFGIAKDMDVTALTAANCTVGTASYMSPEQCRGERDLTPKSDLYSLGVMLYELLTGRKPFLAETPMDMFMQHIQGEFERPSRLVLDTPVWLDNLLCQLLEKKPEHRPRNAQMVAQALGQVAEKVTAQKSAGVDAVQARGIDRPRGAGRPDDTDKAAARTLRQAVTGKKSKRRRQPLHRRVWLQAAGLVGLLLLLIGLLYLGTRPASPEKLYHQAEKFMASKDPDERDKAREPIEDFLNRSPGRQDEQAQQMRRWLDELDLAQRDGQLNRRFHRSLPPADESEQEAYAAVRAENAGELEKALEHWKKLEPLRTESDSNQRAWGLLAQKRVGLLQQVLASDQQVAYQIEQARKTKQPLQLGTDTDPGIVKAAQAEADGDISAARIRWQELKKQFEADTDRQPLFWLAALHERKLLEVSAAGGSTRQQAGAGGQ